MEALRPGDPRRVGRYELLARLGAGGMGIVYLGRSPAGRVVAVKVIRERFAGDDGFVARFRREVAAARLVTGAFTAPLLDADTGVDVRTETSTGAGTSAGADVDGADTDAEAGTKVRAGADPGVGADVDDEARANAGANAGASTEASIGAGTEAGADAGAGTKADARAGAGVGADADAGADGGAGAGGGVEGPWLVTAYLPGVSLREAVGADGALSPGAVWTLAAGLVEALVDIHGAGVVHRDLKPGNIMLTGDGPRVIDFGIARPEDATAITQVGAVVGSPGYMSPEQRAGHVVGPATDVFSLGAVLVFAATGREPFRAAGEVGRRGDVDLSDVGDRGLRGLIEACLRGDPARRPSAVDLLERLPADGAREGVLPIALVALVEHRVRQAKHFTGGVSGPADSQVTLDPVADGHTEAGTTEPRPVESRGLSRRRLMVIGGGVAVVGGAAAWGLFRGESAVRGVPGSDATSRAASRAAPQRAPGGGLTPVWRQRLSTSAADLIMVGGVLLVCGREAGIRAIEPRTGRLLWSRDEETVETTAGELAFLVNPKGWRLTAVHVRTGAVRWAYTPDSGFQSRPVAVVGPVVWCCLGVMVALDLADGRPLRTAGAWNTDLVTTDGRLVAVWTDRIGGHDPTTGDHLWMVSADEPTDARAAAGLVFYRDPIETVHALRADNGAAVWQRRDLGGTRPSWFQVGRRTAYCSVNGEVVAVDTATGRSRWSVPLGRGSEADDPSGDADRCVLGLVDTTLYAAGVDGTLSAVDAASGRVRWTRRVPGRVVACPVGAGGRVFLADDDGYVAAISPPEGR